jgi:hypothetical protein
MKCSYRECGVSPTTNGKDDLTSKSIVSYGGSSEESPGTYNMGNRFVDLA